MNKKVIFLDRDGVINRDLNSYVTSWEKFEFLEGSLEAIKKLADAGYDVIIVSNQAGVSRGDYTVDELNSINEKMLDAIERAAGRRPTAYYCIHTDEYNCDCRKPRTGLFRQAESAFGKIDFKSTYFIGDQERDIETAKNLGAHALLVLSGKTKGDEVRAWKHRPDAIRENLLDAVNWIFKKD